MRRHRGNRLLIRVTTKCTLVIGLITLGFLVIWQYRAWIGRNEYSISAENVYHEIFSNFTFLTFEHARTLKNGFGRQIIVEFFNASGERTVKNGITLNTLKPSLPKEMDFAGIRSIKVPTEKTVGYVRVLRYWEQMTMNTRALISLAGQAKRGDRKVLAPRVKNSDFGRKGYPLGTYFNMTDFNNILTLNDYATLVSEEDYEAECSLAEASHVAIYFLYGDQETKQGLHLNKKQYDVMRKLAGKVGWTECPSLRYSIKENSNTKFFCVDVGKVTEWDKLEKEIIQGARCVTITNWRGIGGGSRTHFIQKHLKVKVKDLLFALKPSGHILKEADRFRRAYYGPYIGVHIRAEKIFLAHNVSRILDCIRLLAELVKLLKAVSDITHVLIASDTSSFGSYAWEGQEIHQTIKNLHSSLISSIGGSEYKPTAGYLDRGIVALVEMSLLARAKHLITVGKGSFQEWIKRQFLEQHRNDYRPSWSLITICSE